MRLLDMRSWVVCQYGSQYGKQITSFVTQVENKSFIYFIHFISILDGCDQCYLRNIEKPLLTHFSDVLNVDGAKPEDVVFILNTASENIPDAVPAVQFMKQKFPSNVEIKFSQEMEGMEKKVVFNLTNSSIGLYPMMIPLSLTRANNHLVIFCGDDKNILKDAADKGLVKKSTHGVPEDVSQPVETLTRVGLEEAMMILCSLSRTIQLPEIRKLASEWAVLEQYEELARQKHPRYHIIKTMSRVYMEKILT